MNGPVLVGVHAAAGDDGDEAVTALDALLSDSSALATGEVVGWSGPDDGSDTGHLVLANGLDVCVIQKTGGLQVSLCLLSDDPTRSRTLGTVIDTRVDSERFRGVDGGEALRCLADLLARWSEEASRAVPLVRPLTDGPSHERYVLRSGPFRRMSTAALADVTVCALASGGADEMGGAPAISIDHATDHSACRIVVETNPDERWRFDAKTDGMLADRVGASLTIRMRSFSPGPPEAEFTPMESLSWHEDAPQTTEIMRRLGAMGIDWTPTLERLETCA